jgi:hypothetical protein
VAHLSYIKIVIMILISKKIKVLTSLFEEKTFFSIYDGIIRLNTATSHDSF